MSEKLVSFRDYLRERFETLRSGLSESFRSLDFISELVLLLTGYQEEGTDLFPVVFIGDNLEHFQSYLGARELIFVGEGAMTKDTIVRAFKLCAPLAEDRLWAVFMHAENDRIRYGIFRSDATPLTPSVFERLRRLAVPGTSIVGLTRLGENFVEIRTSLGQQKYVNVSGSEEDHYHPGQVVRDFVQTVTTNVDDGVRPLLRSFYQRFAMDVLHASHGCLVGIVPKGQAIPSLLSDGVHLNPPISIAQSVQAIVSSEDDRDSYLRLFSYGQLLRKLTWMDGITLLDTEGTILAFNCFIKMSSSYRAEDSIIGGARRRAYGAMQEIVPSLLTGCLLKSQDGHIEMTGESCGVRVS